MNSYAQVGLETHDEHTHWWPDCVHSFHTKSNNLERRNDWGVGLFFIEVIWLSNLDCWQSQWERAICYVKVLKDSTWKCLSHFYSNPQISHDSFFCIRPWKPHVQMQSIFITWHGRLERSLDMESENLVLWFIIFLTSFYLSLRLLDPQVPYL